MKRSLSSLSCVLMAVICSITSWTACQQATSKKTLDKKDSLQKKAIQEWNKTIPGNFSEQQVLHFDSSLIAGFFSTYPKLDNYRHEVDSFYKKRDYAFAWFDQKGLIEQAGNLADRMLNLQEEGLNKALPYKEALDSLINTYHQQTGNTHRDPQLELMLTAQYFVFAHTAWEGMSETESKANDWFVPRKKISYANYLDSLLSHPVNQQSSTIEPVYRQYEQLKAYLKKYDLLDSLYPWSPLTLDRKSYRTGDSSELISQIRKRLFLLEDYQGDTLDTRYDESLKQGIEAFQRRHGLTVDGAIGPGTISALNVRPKERIKQILVNMERSRWLPVSLSSDYLAVNIPEFALHVYHADSLLWSCNVVVGQAVHKTVIFYGDVKYVVFSPYWNVPPSIVRNEIVPGMRRDRNYIAKHNMEITGTSGGLPTVRQKPGPQNSLGLVKFLFPNSYNIYLHDSPAKSLFNETSRAFSHGCIRVSEPEKLANFLLRNDSTWNAESIHAAMQAGKEKYVTLKKTVPVFIAYFTAFIDREGKINFRKDIYERDERLADMLMSEQKN